MQGSQCEMRLTQAALEQKRLPVERIASLAFPSASGRYSAKDLSLNVRLLGSDWPVSSDSGSPTSRMVGSETRPEEASRDGAATASVGVRPQAVTAVGRRYSFYSPEMNLLAETEIQTAAAPAILYEYIWFNGHPVAQVDAGTTTHWTFTDHLGTPIIQTDSSGAVYWRAEYEPYGKVFALLTADQHQPLRLPGQEAEQLNLGPNGASERSYNILRWYRPSWGKYTQSDPISLRNGLAPANVYAYAYSRPTLYIDPLGAVAISFGPTRYHYGDVAFVLRNCGDPAAGCTTGPIDVECRCYCTMNGQLRATVSIEVQNDIFIATNAAYNGRPIDPGLIRREEEKHIESRSWMANQMKAYGEAIERIDFPSFDSCRQTCQGFMEAARYGFTTLGWLTHQVNPHPY